MLKTPDTRITSSIQHLLTGLSVCVIGELVFPVIRIWQQATELANLAPCLFFFLFFFSLVFLFCSIIKPFDSLMLLHGFTQEECLGVAQEDKE